MTRHLLLLLPALTGCKLLLGPPLKPGIWDVTLTGMDIGDDCDPDQVAYEGATAFSGTEVRWTDMQVVEIDPIGDGAGLELGDFPGFDLDFDGERTYTAGDGLPAEIDVSAGSCEATADGLELEGDDRLHFYGRAVLSNLRGYGCEVEGDCALRLWFEGDWAERD